MTVRVKLIITCFLFSLVLTGCFPKHAGSRLAHFDTESPAVGGFAPQTTLVDSAGRPISIIDYVSEKPLVVQFGSHTCPVYRYRRFSMEKLYSEFKDQVNFLLVYTREAHPVGSKSPYDDKEWVTAWNRVPRVLLEEPATLDQRVARAKWSKDTLGIRYPVLVDSMNNATWTNYGRAASPAFVIDVDGRIALRQVWVDPKVIREKLATLLNR